MARGKGKSNAFCDIDPSKCLEPTGKNIGWVFCEACSKWFHCKCVKVDAKRAAEDDFIFHCEDCQPIKKKEFESIREKLITALETLMKSYPAFATPMIARKHFVSKAKSNDYHSAGDTDVPATLKALSERVPKKIETLDHFRYLQDTMVNRMNEFLKADMAGDIKAMNEKLKKAVVAIEKAMPKIHAPPKKATPPPPAAKEPEKKGTPAKANAKSKQPPAKKAPPPPAKRGGTRGQQKSSEDSNKENDDSEEAEQPAPAAPPAPAPTRRGRAAAAAAAKEIEKKAPPPPAAAAVKAPPAKTAKAKAAKEEPAKEEKKEEPPAAPVAAPPSKPAARGGGRRGRGAAAAANKQEPDKKAEDKEDTAKIDAKKPKKTDEPKPMEVDSNKKEEPKEDEKMDVDPPVAVVAAPSAKPTGAAPVVAPAAAPQKGKRKAGGKAAKANEAKKAKLEAAAGKAAQPATATIKLPMGSPGKGVVGLVTLPNAPLQLSPKTIATSDGNKVVNIASLLPTSPAPRMQTGVVRPGPQLIQIRPGSAGNATMAIRPPGGPGNLVQVRPPVSIRPTVSGAGPAGAAGPQFFKIVGGKPIQLSGISGPGGVTTAGGTAVLATSTSPAGTVAGSPMAVTGGAGGPRIVYVRKPTPTSILNAAATGATTSAPASVITTAAGSGSPTKVGGAGGAGSKIIFVSNKNQAGGVRSIAPGGVVKLVSSPTAGAVVTSTGANLPPGILNTLRPVAVNSNSASGNAGGPRAPGAPLLLRTVMPKPPAVFQKANAGSSAAVAASSATTPATSSAASVPQLPSVPIPKNKLNSTDKKGAANSTAAAPAAAAASAGAPTPAAAPLDPKMQAMLPKRPIPLSQKAGTPSSPPKIIKKVISSSQVQPTLIMPQAPLPLPANTSPAKQQITTISGPFVWRNSSQTNFKLSSRINFASFAKFKETSDAFKADQAAAKANNKSGKGGAKGGGGKKGQTESDGIHFTLATIVTDDNSNEFTFRLNLKSEPNDSSKSFLELEARSRKPHNDHKWNLKVKTSPPNHLVSGGTFASGNDKAKVGATAFRIPKLVSDLKFVDYELQIDKVVALLPQQPLPVALAPSMKTGITTAPKVAAGKATKVLAPAAKVALSPAAKPAAAAASPSKTSAAVADPKSKK